MRNLIAAFLLSLLVIPGLCIAQGVRTWYGNDEFMQQLDTQISAFFGDSVGTYFQRGGSAYVYTPTGRRTEAVTLADSVSVAHQFLAVFGNGVPDMQTLPDQNTLYSFAVPQDGMQRVAIVTPPNSTSILAAAIVHYSCGHVTQADAASDAVVKANFSSPACTLPHVTIFFKNEASQNSIVRTELMKWGADPTLEVCVHAPWRGCKVRYNVVTINP